MDHSTAAKSSKKQKSKKAGLQTAFFTYTFHKLRQTYVIKVNSIINEKKACVLSPV
jgi:hypothetical protein